jgi:hypothetical protein
LSAQAPKKLDRSLLEVSALISRPFNMKKGILNGQAELFELPDIGLGNVNGRANDNQVAGVNHLFDQRKLAA